MLFVPIKVEYMLFELIKSNKKGVIKSNYNK